MDNIFIEQQADQQFRFLYPQKYFLLRQIVSNGLYIKFLIHFHLHYAAPVFMKL